jgi:SAM-dependent methyltransferase
MPTLNWLKKEFSYGYDSGNILSIIPSATQRKEEKLIGGSYKTVFLKAVLPYIKSNSVVLELGPGKGSWSRAILKHIPHGELHTVDFQNVEQWLDPGKFQGRLTCHKVEDNSFSCIQDNYFDFFWSFGVLCHNNVKHIKEILQNSLPKLKPGGIAVHQYADWDKLEAYGWEKGTIPLEFKEKPDDSIWWPRNTQQTMRSLAESAGWSVVCSDLSLVKRDSIIVLKKG